MMKTRSMAAESRRGWRRQGRHWGRGCGSHGAFGVVASFLRPTEAMDT